MSTNTALNTTAGETIAREMLITYLNTGTSSAPVWSPFGLRVEDSSIELDWNDESVQDILGNTFTELKNPTMTQSFDPYPMDSADVALAKIYQLAVVEKNARALASQDVLLVHKMTGAAATPWAERYPQSAVRPTSIGGEGGGSITMPIDVTFGGVRQVGTVSTGTGGAISFTPSN